MHKSIQTFFVCCLLLIQFKADAQVTCGYAFEYTANMPYTPLSSGQQTLILASGSGNPADPNSVSPTDEDIFANQPIGFPFQFNGSNYTHCGVSTNGWIWFGDVNPVKAAGMVIPFTNILQSETEIEGIVSALNGDLEGRWTAGLASIRTQQSGAAPNRTFTIEWTNFKALDDAEGTGYCGDNRNRFDFQIILEEANNRISFAYNAAPYCWQGYENYFQVGLRGRERSDVHARSVSAGANAWANSILGYNNSTTTIRSSSPTTLPAQNARFHFSPNANPASMVWLGSNSNWMDPSNWSQGAIPSRCNDVLIPSGLNHYPELVGNQTASCANLTVQAGAALTLGNSYSSFLSCFGSLINHGTITNNTSTYITLAGGENRELGGDGYFLGADLFITGQSSYHLSHDLVIRNLKINDGARLELQEYVLDVFSILQQGTLNQGHGVLVIEGDASSVQLNDSTFEESQGTTFFGNGEVWGNQLNQTVPSINYNHLWVRTSKETEVQLGTDFDFYCKNLMFYNPGEAGGIARTHRNITVGGSFRLGIDSLPGTSLVLNHAINRVNGLGDFSMGTKDALSITHAPATQQSAMTGFQTPSFIGSVTYQSNQAQTIIPGTYSNLTIKGSGLRTIHGKVNLRGILSLENGQLVTNDSLTLKSDSATTALISGSGNGTVSGQVESERYIHGSGQQQVFLSSPFVGLDIIDYATAIPVPGPDGVQWIEDSSPSIWEYRSEAAEDNFMSGWFSMGSNRAIATGQGLQATVDGGTVVRIQGSIAQGTQMTPVFAEGNQDENPSFNLLGNPYPSPIDWNKLIYANSGNLSKTMYRMGSGNRYNGNYAGWIALNTTEGLGINGATKYIGVQEGFFVKAFLSDSLYFRNTDRVDVLDVRAVQVSSQVSYLRLSLDQSGKSDETLIYYRDNVDNDHALDGQDAIKMEAAGVNFWYSLKDSVKLGIQGRQTAYAADSIPLDLMISQAGYFSMRLTEVVHFPATAMVFLEDRLNGIFQNLRQTPEYEVYLNAGAISGRFFLHYRPGVQVQAIREGCQGGDGQLSFNNPTTTSWDIEAYTETDSLVAERTAFTGSWVKHDLPYGEYRIHYTLNGQNLQLDEWVQIAQGNGINASFMASATEVKQEEEEVIFTNTTSGAQSLFWDFGDGMVVSGESELSHSFNEQGTYAVTLTASREECMDTAQIQIHVITITGIDEQEQAAQQFTLFPNPAVSSTFLKLASKETLLDLHYVLVDAGGRIALEKSMNSASPDQLIEIPLTGLAPGAYEVVVHAKNFRSVSRLLVSPK